MLLKTTCGLFSIEVPRATTLLCNKRATEPRNAKAQAEHVNHFCLAQGKLKRCEHIYLLTINLKVSTSLFCLLQGSQLVKQRRTGDDESTSLPIRELFGLTHMLQVVMNMDFKLEPIPDKSVAYLSTEHIFFSPWGILYKKLFHKDSFLVCIITQKMEARKFPTQAAKKGAGNQCSVPLETFVAFTRAKN